MGGLSSMVARPVHPFLRAGMVSLLIHLGVALAIIIGARVAPRVASFAVDLIIEDGDATIERPHLAGGLIGLVARGGPDQPERRRADGLAPALAGRDGDDELMAPTLIVAFEAASIDIHDPRGAPARQVALARPTRADAGQPAVQRAALATQTPGDFVRAQIMARWQLDWRAPRFNGRSLTIEMVLLSTGMFAYPYGRDDPWDPRAMVTNYDELIAEGHHDLIEMVETLLRAMRAAQPIEMPPRLRRFPMRLDLSFRLGER